MSVLSGQALALCQLASHEVDSYDSTESDPGADVCREEECYSEMLVGLWNASQALREALAHLCCPCSAPASCDCSFEMLRIHVGVAERNVDHELDVLLACQFPLDSSPAEAALAGLHHEAA